MLQKGMSLPLPNRKHEDFAGRIWANYRVQCAECKSIRDFMADPSDTGGTLEKMGYVLKGLKSLISVNSDLKWICKKCSDEKIKKQSPIVKAKKWLADAPMHADDSTVWPINLIQELVDAHEGLEKKYEEEKVKVRFDPRASQEGLVLPDGLVESLGGVSEGQPIRPKGEVNEHERKLVIRSPDGHEAILKGTWVDKPEEPKREGKKNV